MNYYLSSSAGQTPWSARMFQHNVYRPNKIPYIDVKGTFANMSVDVLLERRQYEYFSVWSVLCGIGIFKVSYNNYATAVCAKIPRDIMITAAKSTP